MREDRVHEGVRPPFCYHIFDDELSDDAKITMISIQELVDEKEPLNIPVVAKRSGKNPFTVKRHMDELEEAGLAIRDVSEEGISRYRLRGP